MLPATATAPLPALDLRLGAKKFVPETKEREREGGRKRGTAGRSWCFSPKLLPSAVGDYKKGKKKSGGKSFGAVGKEGEGTNGAGLFNSCGECRLNNAG